MGAVLRTLSLVLNLEVVCTWWRKGAVPSLSQVVLNFVLKEEVHHNPLVESVLKAVEAVLKLVLKVVEAVLTHFLMVGGVVLKEVVDHSPREPAVMVGVSVLKVGKDPVLKRGEDRTPQGPVLKEEEGHTPGGVLKSPHH